MRNHPESLPTFLAVIAGVTLLLLGYSFIVETANRHSPSAIVYPIHATR